MKKYLFIALAALAFAACADKVDNPNAPIHNGELEESYIAINLMSADLDTRAAEDDYGYEDGTEAERKINSAYFFFFDAEGNAFNVTTSAPGGQKNHMPLTIGATTGEVDPNVSDIKEAVLVLNTYKGVYPSQIVAVINWVPTNNTYSLNELHEELATIGNDTDGYVMSNSVYMDGAGKMVDAVPLTAANIKTSEADAKTAPVEIYVERTAAKVVLTASKKIEGTDNIFDTQKNTYPVDDQGAVASAELDVYVKLLGWELYNDYATSNLLKNINTDWDVTTLGLTWNDIPYYRCYWAESQDTTLSDSFSWSYASGFPTAYGFAVGAYTYCGENTWPVTIDSEGKVTPNPNNTKVILKGQLMQKDGEGYKPLELARWYGTEYAGNQALRIAVANSLKYTLFSSADGATFTSIQPEDLQCVASKDIDPNAASYKVSFQLSTTEGNGVNKRWYLYNSEQGYVAFGDTGTTGDNAAKANAHLATVEPALLYANGMTYYTVDIEHLGTKEAKYGVVRNHVYQVDINTIKGFGSPVYDGLDFVVDKPEYPTEDEASYVAARINVLSWKIVKQGVNIVQ